MRNCYLRDMAGKKGRGVKLVIVFVAVGLVVWFLWFMVSLFTGGESQKTVTIALELNGEKYVYAGNGFLVENAIGKGEAPMLIPNRGFYKIDGAYFLAPGNMDPFVNILSGNFGFMKKQEPSFDGYAFEGDFDEDWEISDKQYSNEATDKIGVMKSLVNLTLKDTSGTKEYLISWFRNDGQAPIKNCVEKSVWIDASYKPGTTTYTTDDVILIPLNDLVDFYNPNAIVTYEDDVVMIKLN
ncbi:MAG: hypothetical protein ACI9J3_001282 [Parvicellaceae bacterium]|jgi:hypothetical protein